MVLLFYFYRFLFQVIDFISSGATNLKSYKFYRNFNKVSVDWKFYAINNFFTTNWAEIRLMIRIILQFLFFWLPTFSQTACFCVAFLCIIFKLIFYSKRLTIFLDNKKENARQQSVLK